MSEAVGGKKNKMCATCRYWTGTSVRVTSPLFIKFERNEKAVCNQTGFEKSPTQVCNKYEKRLDF